MNNEEMRHRMESMKFLLEGIAGRAEALPEDPPWDDVMDRGNHLRMFDELFREERDWYMNSVSPNERSMEVLALMGFIELRVRETGLKLIEFKRKHEEKNPPAARPSGHPIVDLLRGLQKNGDVDVAVVDLRDALGAKKEEDCNNPNCPIHGKKEKKVEGNN